jgi:hypothetical protein
MPGKSNSAADATFILLGYNDKGAIDSATSFRAPPADGKRAAAARALIVGLKKFQAYRIKPAGKGDNLDFERL